ncbi:MAG TPA: (2Fe-2S) ferredoxin domain-containing protein [Egibacteraceae bacterium]|nr:(2Fe-2S) ferredoxin domain-containing protein [Egibacteraceae bacterium]
MPKPEKFAFVCINQRDPAHARPSCINNGSADVFNALREEQGKRLATGVKVVAGGCLEACMVGPVMVVYPDDVWYGGVTEADVPAIMDHLEGGDPVEYLVIGDTEFDLRPPEMQG